MQIDWLTVAAQIVNFFILVWLLRRFLYGPVMGAMQRREERIAYRLQEAERQESEAQEEARNYRDKQAALERQREDMLEEARKAAEVAQKSFEYQAREDVAARKRDWLEQLAEERKIFLHNLRRQSTEEFFVLARRTLADLADAGLEERIVLSFIRQLHDMDKTAKEKIVRASAEAGGKVKIRSRFELSAAIKRETTIALRHWLGGDIEVDYEQDDDASCGIELKTNSQTIMWNFDSYLDGFEKAVEEHMAQISVPPEEQADG